MLSVKCLGWNVEWKNTKKEGMSKVEKIRIGLLVGGYSIPAIPTQSTENEGRVEGVSKLPDS